MTCGGGKLSGVKQIWTGRMVQAASRYGDMAPQATVCCNACRTCVTSNLLAAGMAGMAAAGVTVGRFARRLAKPS